MRSVIEGQSMAFIARTLRRTTMAIEGRYSMLRSKQRDIDSATHWVSDRRQPTLPPRVVTHNELLLTIP